MKSTLQQLREIPSYPRIAARLVALFHAIFGGISVLYGYALLTSQQQLMLSLAFISTLNGVRLPLADIDLLLKLLGGSALFMGILALWVAFGIFRENPAIWRQLIILDAWLLLGWMMGPKNFFVIIDMFLSAVSLLLFLFDARVKALFGRVPNSVPDPRPNRLKKLRLYRLIGILSFLMAPVLIFVNFMLSGGRLANFESSIVAVIIGFVMWWMYRRERKSLDARLAADQLA